MFEISTFYARDNYSSQYEIELRHLTFYPRKRFCIALKAGKDFTLLSISLYYHLSTQE